MAETSVAVSPRQSGLGPFSLLLGAVLLLLLGGLFVADRTLATALAGQAESDAIETSLALEDLLAARVEALHGFRGMFLDGALERRDFDALVAGAAHSGLATIWVVDSVGRALFDTVLAEPAARVPVTDPERQRLVGEALRTARTQLGAPRRDLDRSPALLVAEPLVLGGRVAGVAGTRLTGDAILSRVARRDSRWRTGILVRVGTDTLAAWSAGGKREGDLRRRHEVRAPGGGIWTVEVSHRGTGSALRLALWGLGLVSIVFLVLGLSRERRHAEGIAARSAELERLSAELLRANRMKSEFLANVSHELRTPLNAIVGFVELLRDGVYGELAARQVPPVERIAASATHLRHLVDQVLDIAKIAAGRLEVHPEAVALRPFVLEVASDLESLVSEKGLTLSISVPQVLPRVRTDPQHLRQILVNLFGNAVKYTPQGSVSIRAKLLSPAQGSREEQQMAFRAPNRDRSWVAVQVSDTGIGISPADQERIFDEFEQVNAGPRGDSAERGSGLGLSISRRLSRLLGGDLTVESEQGRGSTFTLWLPAEP
ncbi:MAG: sensor histidine kinase [Gemmatimonadaceae bacterium]